MKKMIALLLAAMLLLSLAACASTADPAPAADAAPAETAETTPAAEEAPAAETDAEVPITLTYWLPCNDLEDGAAEQKGTIAAARAFMEKYPNITLDLVPIGGNSDDYNAKFQMGASANNLPDLMNTSYGWVKQWAGTGVIMQLDDIVAEIGGNYKTDALDFANEAVDGYWAIPYMAEVQGWAYNTGILGKYGLEVPTTFDEFINVCNVLTENGERAISHGATDIWAIWGYHALFCQYGVDKALCEKLSAKEEDFYTCEPFRKTLARIQQIARAQRVEDLTVGGRQRDDALCGRVQRDLPAGHVGQGNGGGGVLCFRFLCGSRFFFCGGRCFRFRSRLALGGFFLCRLRLRGAAGQHGQQHHRRQQQGKKLILFHNSISLFVIKRLPAAFVRMEGPIFYLQTGDLSSFRASRPVSANASGGSIFSALPEKMGKKRGAGLRLVHPAGAVHASTRFIVAASTHTHPTGAMVRAACYGTPNLQAAAIQYLR